MSESLPCQATKFVDNALCAVSKPFKDATIPFAGTPCIMSNLNTMAMCSTFDILDNLFDYLLEPLDKDGKPKKQEEVVKNIKKAQKKVNELQNTLLKNPSFLANLNPSALVKLALLISAFIRYEILRSASVKSAPAKFAPISFLFPKSTP